MGRGRYNVFTKSFLVRRGKPVITIKAIAERCGCSPATVSKALNGGPDVSQRLAERIQAAAAEMGYIPNSAARALKTARTYSFGVLFKEASQAGLSHEFFSLMLNGFKSRAGELGYDIAFISDRLGDRQVTYAQNASYRRYDGVAVITAIYDEPQVRQLADSGIPTVTVDYEFDGCGCVLSDNLRGIRDLVRHVYDMGHRRIAFIHGEPTAVTRIRVAGFYRTCAELGLTVPESYVLPAVFHDPPSSAEQTRRLLALPERPSCILYPDDVSYLGGLQAIEDMGLSVPGDVSAAGYDGIELGRHLHPKLTTLRQEAAQMGARAAEELARAVDEGRSYIPGRTVIAGRLIPGETVKRLA